jgi:hypothetical protein
MFASPTARELWCQLDIARIVGSITMHNIEGLQFRKKYHHSIRDRRWDASKTKTTGSKTKLMQAARQRLSPFLPRTVSIYIVILGEINFRTSAKWAQRYEKLTKGVPFQAV